MRLSVRQSGFVWKVDQERDCTMFESARSVVDLIPGGRGEYFPWTANPRLPEPFYRRAMSGRMTDWVNRAARNTASSLHSRHSDKCSSTWSLSSAVSVLLRKNGRSCPTSEHVVQPGTRSTLD
jgi:hypothetical protein